MEAGVRHLNMSVKRARYPGEHLFYIYQHNYNKYNAHQAYRISLKERRVALGCSIGRVEGEVS